MWKLFLSINHFNCEPNAQYTKKFKFSSTHTESWSWAEARKLLLILYSFMPKKPSPMRSCCDTENFLLINLISLAAGTLQLNLRSPIFLKMSSFKIHLRQSWAALNLLPFHLVVLFGRLSSIVQLKNLGIPSNPPISLPLPSYRQNASNSVAAFALSSFENLDVISIRKHDELLLPSLSRSAETTRQSREMRNLICLSLRWLIKNIQTYKNGKQLGWAG